MTAAEELAGGEVLSTALALARAGYALTPVRIDIGPDGKKKPRPCLKGWRASTDPEQIRDWFAQFHPNVWAQVCAASGVDVVDIDAGAGGPASYADVALPVSTMRVSTPGGGWHYLFAADPARPLGVTAGRLPGVDTRSAGSDTKGGISFIVGVLPDGRMWKPDEVVRVAALPATPERLRPLFASTAGVLPPRRLPAGGADDPFGAPAAPRIFTRSQALAFWNDQLARIEGIASVQGARHITLVQVARALGIFDGAVPGIRDATWSRLRLALDGQPGVDIAAAARTFADMWSAAVDRAQVIDDPPADPFGGPDASGPVPDGGDSAVRVLSDADLDDLPPVRSLVKGVMSRGSLVLLAGMNQSYKSFVALDWACSIATGTPWLGRQVKAAEPVLYIAAEGAYGIRQRRAAWKRQHGVQTLDNFHLVPHAVQFRDSARQAALLEHIERLRPALVVVDTVHQSAAGLNENDAGEMSTVMARARDMTQWGATVVLVHHTGHAGERARGSSSLGDDADEVWLIKRDDVETPGLDVVRTMHHWKAKDSQLSPEIELKASPVDTGYRDEDGEVVTSLVLAEEKPLEGSVSVLRACALLELGAVDDDPAPGRTATRGTNKDTVKRWLRGHHPEVRFPGKNSFWAEVVHHYRACTITHPEVIVSVPTEGDEKRTGDQSSGLGTSGDPFARPAS